MTTISAATPSIGDTLAQLISGGALTPAVTGTDPASSTATTSTDSSGPATFVTLSDQAKAAAATKALSDQTAAENLQAYVEAHRVNGAGTQTTATSASDAQPTTSSKVEVIVAQIKAFASANEPQPFQPFTPTKSLSNSVTVDGYTLSLSTNASTQFYGIQLSGNGVSLYDKHFGPSDGAGGGDGGPLPAGVGISIGIPGNNNEAIDAITVTQNVATASSASVSSSAGSVSTSSVNAQSSSITFLVNYATGQIAVQQSAESVSARSALVGSPGSTLSSLA